MKAPYEHSQQGIRNQFRSRKEEIDLSFDFVVYWRLCYLIFLVRQNARAGRLPPLSPDAIPYEEGTRFRPDYRIIASSANSF
jgi:hypothetical protein